MEKTLARFIWADWFFLMYNGIGVGSHVTRYIKGCPIKHKHLGGGGVISKMFQTSLRYNGAEYHKSQKKLKFGFGKISFFIFSPVSDTYNPFYKFGAPLLETLRSTIATCPSKKLICFLFSIPS